MLSVLEDRRPIKSLSCNLSRYTWHVGKNGVTKIEAYSENGHTAKIPWFAIWVDEKMTIRADGLGKTVAYD